MFLFLIHQIIVIDYVNKHVSLAYYILETD